ncbi:MAG: liaR 5 [Ilumatobacteraceae bacterium]|nr:liaR 5 [Ilumatobacteraceae bacterium]
MIRVLVADDHAVIRNGLQQLLSTTDDLELIGAIGDGAAAVALAVAEQPDVVLMDLSMPVLDGIEATRQILAVRPLVRVVVLTSFSDNRRILEALKAGAVGYLLKHASADELLNGIRAAAAGDSPLDPKAARVMLESHRAGPNRPDLTLREREVLQLVAAGDANKQIARKLGITERTVKSHLTNIFSAISVSSRTQAALWAKQHLTDEP